MPLLARMLAAQMVAVATNLAHDGILSGLAVAVAGSSRPCSGGDHEIMHAIDQFYPGARSHGELAGVGALFCACLRENDLRAPCGAGCRGSPKAGGRTPGTGGRYR
jgi:glycerol-1-phosphate dehydrogenase [NAD(P)+]